MTGQQDDFFAPKKFEQAPIEGGDPQQAAMKQTIEADQKQAEAVKMLSGGGMKIFNLKMLNLKSRKNRKRTSGKSKKCKSYRNYVKSIRNKRRRFFYKGGSSDEVPRFYDSEGSGGGAYSASATSLKGNQLLLDAKMAKCGDVDSEIPCPQSGGGGRRRKYRRKYSRKHKSYRRRFRSRRNSRK